MGVTRSKVNFTLNTMYSRGTSKYIWKLKEFTNMFDEQEMRKRINYFIGSEINRFVPKSKGGGSLRASMDVQPDRIIWGEGLDYAQYQFGGVVYEPNYPRIEKDTGKIVGWYSPKNGTKHPTNRELGVPGEWRGWKFGYSTPNTQHHWTDVYQGELKRKTNLEITNYIKKECKMRGLNV